MKKTLYTLWLLIVASLLSVTASAQQYSLSVGDRIETPDGVYIVRGENIVTNGFFTDGLNGWTGGDGKALSASKFSVTESGGPDGGAYLCANSNGGSSSDASIKTGWGVTKGKSYVLNMWSKNAGQYVYLCSSASATSADIANTLVDITTGGEWTQTQAVFEANNDFVVLNGGWLGSNLRLACVTICEVELSLELVFTNLDKLIASAQAKYDNAEEGSAPGQYSAADRQQLADAIAAAQAVRSNAASQGDVNAAVRALEITLSYFALHISPGKKYWIQHTASDAYLTATSTVKVDNDNNQPNQIFTFAWAPEGAEASGFNIVSEEGMFVCRSGSWDTKATSSTGKEKNAIYTIEDHSSYVLLRNAGSNSLLGTDGTTAGSTVYSNKGDGSRSRWRIIEYVSPDDQDDEFIFNRALQQLATLYSSAKDTEDLMGTDPFDYSQQAYDALVAAYEHAVGVTGNFAAETEAIEQAIADYNDNAINRPDPEKQYCITQSSGSVLAYESGKSSPVLQDANGGDNQKFAFVAIPTGYAIRNVASGKYVAKSANSAWDMVWADSHDAAEAQWTVAATTSEFKGIRNVAGKGYIGSDATSSGSPTYCDKAASATNSRWVIEAYSVTAALDKAIVQAEKILSETEVGTEYYQVPQSAYTALQQAISHARSLSPATAEEAAQAAEELNQAVAQFQRSYNPLKPFDTSIAYNIVHRGGMVLSSATGKVTLQKLETEDPDVALTQQFELETVAGSDPVAYRIRNVDSGLYLARTGAYNTEWAALADTTAQQFNIVQTNGRYLGLQFVAEKTYLGTDGTGAGEQAYSDKVASSSYAQWLVQPAEAVTTVDKTALRTALDAAREFLATMVYGNLAGQYYQQDIDAFKAQLAAYESAYRTCRTDEAVVENTRLVNAFVADYQAKAHAEDIDLLVFCADLLADADLALQEAAANIGLDKGCYTQQAYDEFQQYIADFRQQPTVEVMNELKARIAAFRQSTVKIDRTALGTAITQAETYYATVSVGQYDGQTPEPVVTRLLNLIAEAKAMHAAPLQYTQSELNTMKSNLEAAVRDCKSQTVTVVFAQMDAASSSLQTLFADIPADRVGNADNCVDPETYNTARDMLAEVAAIDRKAISQIDVDKLAEDCGGVQTLLIQAMKDACQLDILIGDSQDLYDTDGFNLTPVQRATFRRAIEAAQQLLDADYATWPELCAAADRLTQARDLFQQQIIDGIHLVASPDAPVTVHNLRGQLVATGLCRDVAPRLRPGRIYIVNGRKVLIK